MAAVVKKLKVNKFKLNPDKTEVMLVGKAEVLMGVVIPAFDRGQLTGVGLGNSLGVILDSVLLQMQVNAAAKMLFPTIIYCRRQLSTLSWPIWTLVFMSQ